jgi:SAM-dependent methyltransferase
VIETDQRLSQYLDIWQRKPVLRQIYSSYYQRITAACKPGRILEIGSGSGNFLQGQPSPVVRTDILPASWLSLVCDAQQLPFASQSFDSIVMVDVLHHIERPIRFFREAERVLTPGGRIVCVEPAITPLSWPFYHFLHPEPVNLNADPLADGPLDPKRDPYDSNQAIPTLLAGRDRGRFRAMFPSLQLVSTARFDFFAYPFSGGFRSWSLLPERAVGGLIRFESYFEKSLGRLMAFRLLAVYEKSDGSSDN